MPAANDYSDMTRGEVIKMLEQVLEESRGLNKQISDLNNRIAEKDKRIEDLMEKMLKLAEEKTELYNTIATLKNQNDNYLDQLAQQRKGLYGRKCQKGTSVTKHKKIR